MLRFDMYLLNKYQSAQDYFQDKIGATCFTLARISALLITTGPLCTIGTFKEEMGLADMIALFAVSLLFLGILFRSASIVERKVLSMPDKMNPLAQRPFSRILLAYPILYLGLNALVEMITIEKCNHGNLKTIFWSYATPLSMLIGLKVFAYFISCTPKPPRPSKAKQMIQKLLSRPAKPSFA